jgi:nucleoside-diphosphate-sugar epimerase
LTNPALAFTVPAGRSVSREARASRDVSPDGSRSFPRKNLSKGVGEWHHYYVPIDAAHPIILPKAGPASGAYDRVFYAATGQPLVTAAQAAKLVMEQVAGADIEIGDVLSEDDEVELGFRGVLSIENARRQLGWEPTYSSLRDRIAEYVSAYRDFLAGHN